MLRLANPLLLGTALMACVAVPASAADYYEPPIVEAPPPVYYKPEPKKSFGGWYIRGHIGMSNQRVDSVSHPGMNFFPTEWLQRGSFDSAPIFGIGAGYQVNKYLRGDITLEYRGGANFRALDRLERTDLGPDVFATNDYRARKTEWLMLANAYVDVGKFWKISPYVGAGIGLSRNTISDFRELNIEMGGGQYAAAASQLNFAWALHAGLGFDVTENTTIDLGYSFVNLGNARTATVMNDDPTEPSSCQAGGICAPLTFNRLVSHDLKLGLRYKFGEKTVHHAYDDYQPLPAYEPAPIVGKF